MKKYIQIQASKEGKQALKTLGYSVPRGDGWIIDRRDMHHVAKMNSFRGIYFASDEFLEICKSTNGIEVKTIIQ